VSPISIITCDTLEEVDTLIKLMFYADVVLILL